MALYSGPTSLAIWIDSYAPSHQVRFGSLNYTADIRRDLIFDGFEPMLGAPHSLDEHDLALPSDGVREITPVATPAFDPEQIMSSEDGWTDPATETAHSVAIEPDTDFTPYETCVAGPLDSSPSIGSEPLAFVPIRSDWAPTWSFPRRISFSTHPWATC